MGRTLRPMFGVHTPVPRASHRIWKDNAEERAVQESICLISKYDHEHSIYPLDDDNIIINLFVCVCKGADGGRLGVLLSHPVPWQDFGKRVHS